MIDTDTEFGCRVVHDEEIVHVEIHRDAARGTYSDTHISATHHKQVTCTWQYGFAQAIAKQEGTHPVCVCVAAAVTPWSDLPSVSASRCDHRWREYARDHDLDRDPSRGGEEGEGEAEVGVGECHAHA